jgi:hypothetical protein
MMYAASYYESEFAQSDNSPFRRLVMPRPDELHAYYMHYR